MGSDVGNKMTLNEKMQEKSTNVNLIRFFAAAGVLVSHAHVLVRRKPGLAMPSDQV